MGFGICFFNYIFVKNMQNFFIKNFKCLNMFVLQLFFKKIPFTWVLISGIS